MIRLLHLSYDWPDPFNPSKPNAVKSLVQLVPEFEHRVLSLNRARFPPFDKVDAGTGVTAFRLPGLPWGILHSASMALGSRILLDYLHTHPDWRPDLIHGHKLTFEGPLASSLAKAFDVPYLVTLRGNTDARLMRWAPHLRPRFQRVIEEAAGVLAVSPWSIEQVEHYLPGSWNARAVLLPNPVPLASEPPEAPPEIAHFVLLMRLTPKNLHFKNIRRMLAALRRVPGCHLDIWGEGEARRELEALVAKSGLQDRVHLKGHIPNAEVPALLGRYTALAMPSVAETLGISFIEALAAGIPILHPRNCGVDGFFTHGSEGVAVDPHNVDEIAKALQQLASRAKEYRASVKVLIESGGLAPFSPPQVASAYRQAVLGALGSAP